MKITYDAEADALSIVFAETTVTTQHLADGRYGPCYRRQKQQGRRMHRGDKRWHCKKCQHEW
jgi:hypothetical protein